MSKKDIGIEEISFFVCRFNSTLIPLLLFSSFFQQFLLPDFQKGQCSKLCRNTYTQFSKYT